MFVEFPRKWASGAMLSVASLNWGSLSLFLVAGGCGSRRQIVFCEDPHIMDVYES